MRIQLLYIGKARSRPLNQAAQEYAKRLSRYCRFEMREIKGEKDAPDDRKALRVLLDPLGKQLTSAGLAQVVEESQRDISFYVGGADGWSDEFRAAADRLLSLSKMVLPHELARVVLAEQIYRSFTILRNHPYPR